MPEFTGQVSIDIVYGTKYDYINIPYYTAKIKDEATKIVHKEAYAVLQNTWISTIDVELDYNDEVGAQIIIVTDAVEVQNFGLHYYWCSAPVRVNKKTCRFTLVYDPLLSIGVPNLKTISGKLLRWTVDNDEPWRYCNTPEPLNQGDSFDYSYNKLSLVGNNNMMTIVGSPYDLMTPFQIARFGYDNTGKAFFDVHPQGVESSIKDQLVNARVFPRFNIVTPTRFESGLGGFRFDDANAYYNWGLNQVQNAYNDAIAAGSDPVSVAYAIPYNLVSASGAQPFTTIIGNSGSHGTGLGTRTGSYNNNKSEELGNWFTVYNEITGDAYTLEGKDISGSSVTLEWFVNPYVTGCIMCRIAGTLKDTSGHSGIVKSSGWARKTITSDAVIGINATRMSNDMNIAQAAGQLRRDISQLTLTRMGETAYNEKSIQASNAQAAIQTFGAVTNMLNAAGNLTSSPFAVLDNNNLNAAMGNVYHATNYLSSAVDSAFASDKTRILENNAEASYTQLVSHLQQQLQAQIATINFEGNIAASVPPYVKFGGTDAQDGTAYDFYVRKSTYSANDRRKMDAFFTAYGYNVDSLPLTSPTQLNTRTRFTFVQALDFRFSATLTADNTRLLDPATIANITTRFATGLRIWQVEPDYNFTQNNPIRG